MKQGSVRTNATGHAAFASGTATELATSGNATEHATSGKDPQLERMFQEACSSAPPKMQSLLQELHALGRYPKRYKQPASKMEKESDGLAQKLAKARSSFTPAVQKYVEALRSTSTATEHAQQAQGLMQQVRALGRMPKESHDPKECRLAHQLRDALATGLMTSYESELRDLEIKDAEAVAASTATEHAQQAEGLMQQVRALGRMPRESHDPKECRLARQLRDALATGLMIAHEPELASIEAADERRRVIAAATERKKSLAAFYYEVDTAVSQNLSIDACRSLAARLHDFRHDPLLQSTDAQALVEELQWMLARVRQSLRTANQKAAAKSKHAKLAARRRNALATVKETLRQWRAAEDKCNCHDFTCWREVWELDPLAATTLRASNHHVHGCHMKQTSPADYLDFLCPQCGLVLLQPLREHDSHLERHSDCTQSIHSSDTGESVESLGEGRVYRKVPVSYFTHGSRIMLGVSHHPNMLPDYASDNEEMRREREQARTEECTCDLPVYGQYKGFFKLGIKSTCKHCTSSIEAGVLYGGYDAERDRFYWKEFTFHHCLGECGLPGPFPGRTSRQWQASIDEPIFKTPGGIQHEAYQQLLKHCGATADFIIHRYRLGLSGKLLRGKPTISTLLMKARTPGSGYSTFNRFPGVTSPLKQEPDFQFDDADVAKSWSKLQLDLVDEIPPPMVAQLLMDAKDVLGWFPQVQCAIRSQAQRTETRVALLWRIWRSRRIPIDLGQGESLLGEVEDVLVSVIDCVTDQAGLKPCPGGAYQELHDDVWNALLHGSASARFASERPGEEHKLVAWARDAEAVLKTFGLGIKGVDGSGVFFHSPSRPMNVERQKQAFIRAGVYHALEICWEPSCYATERRGLSSGDCWWAPRDDDCVQWVFTGIDIESGLSIRLYSLKKVQGCFFTKCIFCCTIC